MENISTLIVSILSGLVGASIAAYFNYKIRLSLLEKSRKDQEQKLAYVYVVQLSQYLAIQVIIKRYVDFFVEQLDDPIPEGEFEFEHAISVLIEDVFTDLDDDFFEKIESVDSLLDYFFEGLSNTYLKNEEQAKLPKRTVLYYQRYEYFLKSTVAAFKLMKFAASNKDQSNIINAKQINDLIETVKSLFQAAGQLRAAMIEFGGIGSVESEFILQQQYENISGMVSKPFKHEEMLKKAKSHLEETGQLRDIKSSKRDAEDGAHS
ncbi:hypothetical protein ACQKC5_02090 [Shewanella baltica]|jgi:hypothetical protein|uniref:hypothetical protein n=1 Tax=Shewanella baltica TaxID=62322 RepID=UPI003CFC424E